MIYPPKVLFIIIVLLSILIFGLYSCGDESTNPTPKPNEEIKKYTLEEILADTNWVEITDTVNIDDVPYLGYSFLSRDWDMFTLIKFLNKTEYKKIEELSDSTSQFFKKGQLDTNINFNQHSMLGFKTYRNSNKYIKMVYTNDKIKQCQYFIKIISKGPVTRPNISNYNFVLIPKLDSSYLFYGDTLQIWEN